MVLNIKPSYLFQAIFVVVALIISIVLFLYYIQPPPTPKYIYSPSNKKKKVILNLRTLIKSFDYFPPVSVPDDLSYLRKKLAALYVDLVAQHKVQNLELADQDNFVNACFQELENYQDDYKYHRLQTANTEDFYDFFFEYIKKTKVVKILNATLNRIYLFISDMPDIVHYKYLYAHKKTPEPPITKLNGDTSFETYIDRLGIFLAYFKHVEKGKKFIRNYQEKFGYQNNNQKDFKKLLVFMWKLGAHICRVFLENRQPKKDIKVFNDYVDYLYGLCQKEKENRFPFGYDWFLFSSHYPTILSYKLFIDYKMKKEINQKWIDEIFFFLPGPNYSKHIQRTNSNAAVISVSYIIAKFFRGPLPEFEKFMNNFFNGEVYKGDVRIKYKDPVDKSFPDGLYIDDGFVVHLNLVSYNYLTAYLYPSVFYKVMFNIDTGNIAKIFKAVRSFASQKRKTNPSLITRYGKFNTINNTLQDFLKNSQSMKVKYENEYIKKYLDNNLEDVQGVRVIESARVVTANFETWSFQMKINCELAFGEVDIYNSRILAQGTMNKILSFDDVEVEELLEHSFYPGVLSYEEHLKKGKAFVIKRGTQTYTFEYVKYTYRQVDRETILVYSVVSNKELELEYEEFVCITKFGIIVGYFNIQKKRADDLYLTLSSELISTKTATTLLYTDDPTETLIKDDAMLQKVRNNILYSNLIKGSPNIKADVLKDNIIQINITFDRIYHIVLNNNLGLQVVTEPLNK